MTNATKSYKRKARFFGIMSMLVTFAPVLIYVIVGFADSGVVESKKVVLGFTAIVAVILWAFNVIAKHHLRSPLFILILGLYVALGNILPLLIMFSVGTIADEFILSPLHKANKDKYIINNEIDKRE